MSNGSFYQLYSASSEPAEAYILSEGSVYFFVSETDKYAIRGNNLIIGATEIILNNLLGISCNRIETAVTESSAKIKKIPSERFLSSMNNYSVAVNTSLVMAKQVLLTNQIIKKNLEGMGGDEKKSKEMAIEYFKIVSRLKLEYEKRKYPWLQGIAQKYETSLLYKRGESLERTAEPTKITGPIRLSDSSVEFKRDSVICEEGSTGDEMYILQSGSIDVIINGNKVTSVSDQGYVFGEIALLLGEKRSATLKAKNDVVLTRLRRENLKNIATENADILLAIVYSLAKKHYYNTEKIATINNLIVEKRLSGDPEKKAVNSHKYTMELLSLKKDTTDIYNSKKADFLKDMVDNF